MSKAVLISIKPKWCEKIANGEKTIEVRKTKPNIETPFKCYIYCTKSRDNAIYKQYKVDNAFCGKVIGEFICDKVDRRYIDSLVGNVWNSADFEQILNDACLRQIEFLDYYKKNDYYYGYHITNLKIYDNPKELSEFWCVGQCCQWNKIEIKENAFGDYVDNCYNNSFCKTCCKYYNHDFGQCDKPYSHFLTRPPQSWCYVEDLGE